MPLFNWIDGHIQTLSPKHPPPANCLSAPHLNSLMLHSDVLPDSSSVHSTLPLYALFIQSHCYIPALPLTFTQSAA